jgi:hypothetical protein
VLKRPDADWVTAAAQALVDGARIALEQDDSALEVMQAVWQVLPFSTRSELWPATYALSNALAFDFLAMSTHEADSRYLNQRQIDTYPEGRYESRLRVAAQTNDADELAVLFRRRSRKQTLRLAVLLVFATIVLSLGMKVLNSLTTEAARNPARPNMSLPQRPPRLPTDAPTT